MGNPRAPVEEGLCDCRKVGRLGCCNGGNRLSHPTTKVTTNYTRSRSLPTVSRRKRNWRRRFEDALAHAVEQGELSRQAEEVAKVLASHSDKHGKNPWPSHKTVGRQRTISVRSVGRQVAELHDKGWIAVLHRFRPTADGVKGRSNEYLLLIPDDLDIAEPRRPPRSPNQAGRPRPAIVGRVEPPITIVLSRRTRQAQPTLSLLPRSNGRGRSACDPPAESRACGEVGWWTARTGGPSARPRLAVGNHPSRRI